MTSCQDPPLTGRPAGSREPGPPEAALGQQAGEVGAQCLRLAASQQCCSLDQLGLRLCSQGVQYGPGLVHGAFACVTLC